MCRMGTAHGWRGRKQNGNRRDCKKASVPAGFCAQNLPGGLHCCTDDPENGYPFAYISDRFLEILGWERAEFAAKFDNRYTPLVHPDDLEAGLRYRDEENGASYAQDGDSMFRLLGKNGYRWVTSAAHRVEWRGSRYIVGIVTDITPYMELRES